MENNNPFKKIGLPPQEVPTDLKKKVLDDVNTAKFLMEVTSLFSSNYLTVLENLFKTKKKDDTNNQKQ